MGTRNKFYIFWLIVGENGWEARGGRGEGDRRWGVAMLLSGCWEYVGIILKINLIFSLFFGIVY
jgi:hypothetical protein